MHELQMTYRWTDIPIELKISKHTLSLRSGGIKEMLELVGF